MDYADIRFDITDGLATIVIDRPSAFNALGLNAMTEFRDAIERCATDSAVRSVLITGAGEKAFCAGGDVAAFASDPERVDRGIQAMTQQFHTAISRMAWMNAPVVAAVNGVAAGAGLSLTAACDLVIAAEHAKFTSAYTQIGLSPDGSSSYFLARLIGVRRAAELFLTNRTLSAAEALDWGLVNRVVPALALADEARALARRLAAGPTRSYGAVKRLLLASANDSLESQMERETRQIVELSKSPDGLEGVRAFVEKRAAVFTGR